MHNSMTYSKDLNSFSKCEVYTSKGEKVNFKMIVVFSPALFQSSKFPPKLESKFPLIYILIFSQIGMFPVQFLGYFLGS